jgi:hypothetical protein
MIKDLDPNLDDNDIEIAFLKLDIHLNDTIRWKEFKEVFAKAEIDQKYLTAGEKLSFSSSFEKNKDKFNIELAQKALDKLIKAKDLYKLSIQDLFNKYDESKSGCLEYNEFRQLILNIDPKFE